MNFFSFLFYFATLKIESQDSSKCFLTISTGIQGFEYKGHIVQWSAASDQQTNSYKLIGINPDTEPPSQFMSDMTWACNDGLNVGAKACILPLSYGYCDKSSVAGMN